MTKVVLSNSQEEACNAFRQFLHDDSQKEFLLSGFAGSGKSFLVKHLVSVADEEYELIKHILPGAVRPRFLFSATTNKAASVLEEISGTKIGEGSTVHKLLGLGMRTNYKTGTKDLEPIKNPAHNLANSIVVIDEGSMINRQLLSMIREITGKYKNCKILYVGDAYQLPPVKEETCSIFFDLEHRKFLTDIQRQAADSPIISYAHKFREIIDDEQLPWPDTPHDGDSILYYKDEDAFKNTMIETFKAFQDDDNVSMVKALAWTNARVRELNKEIREALGFEDPHKLGIDVGETVTSNDTIVLGADVKATTDSRWRVDSITPKRIDDIEGADLSLQSLDSRNAGYIKVFQPKSWTKANAQAKIYAKDRNWQDFYAIKDGWADMRPTYAQTVHKSQGSTYMEVFVDVTDIAKNNKWYEVARLMYVALTRAKFRIHIFGQLPERYNRMSKQTAMEIFNAAQEGEINVPQASRKDTPANSSSKPVGSILGDFL